MANWWYAKNGERKGPVEASELQRLMAQNEVTPADLVWTQGMAQWTPSAQVAALREAPAAPARPAPPAAAPPRPRAEPKAAAPAPAVELAPAPSVRADLHPSLQRAPVQQEPIQSFPMNPMPPAQATPTPPPPARRTGTPPSAAPRSPSRPIPPAPPAPAMPQVERETPAPAKVEAPKPTPAPARPTPPSAATPKPASAPVFVEEETESEDVSSASRNEPSGPLPARAAGILKGFAEPAGDTQTWPINDALFRDFTHAIMLYRRITLAAHVYQVLAMVAMISGIIVVFAGGFMMITSDAGAARRGPGFLILAVLLLIAGVVYGVFARFTFRAHRWAPLTFLILCVGAIGFSIYGMLINLRTTGSSIAGMFSTENAPVTLAIAIVVCVLATFCVVSWRAFGAIPRYLAQPAWCQELIAASGR